jgi:hypothetical protein
MPLQKKLKKTLEGQGLRGRGPVLRMFLGLGGRILGMCSAGFEGKIKE